MHCRKRANYLVSLARKYYVFNDLYNLLFNSFSFIYYKVILEFSLLLDFLDDLDDFDGSIAFLDNFYNLFFDDYSDKFKFEFKLK